MPMLAAILLAASAGAAPRPIPRAPAGASGRVAFFFNDHDALARRGRGELKRFVSRQSAVLLEGVRPGRERMVFQRVADGSLAPSAALALLTRREEPMDAAVLSALYDSGVKVIPEPIFRRENRALRAPIDGALLPAAGAARGKAAAAFADEGDAEKAVRLLETYNAKMAAVHIRREKALAADVARRLASEPGLRLGVVFGSFHLRPYQELKRAGYKTERVFSPPVVNGRLLQLPYTRPLAALRFRKPYRNREAWKKDTASFVLFWELLDRIAKPGMEREKTAVYAAVIDRMSWSDIEALSGEVSEFQSSDGPLPEKAVAREIARWLVRNRFLTPKERRLFR